MYGAPPRHPNPNLHLSQQGVSISFLRLRSLGVVFKAKTGTVALLGGPSNCRLPPILLRPCGTPPESSRAPTWETTGHLPWFPQHTSWDLPSKVQTVGVPLKPPKVTKVRNGTQRVTYHFKRKQLPGKSCSEHPKTQSLLDLPESKRHPTPKTPPQNPPHPPPPTPNRPPPPGPHAGPSAEATPPHAGAATAGGPGAGAHPCDSKTAWATEHYFTGLPIFRSPASD